MTRAAVRHGFESFVDDLIDEAFREFDVVGALSSGTSGGSRVVSSLVKNTRAVRRHVVRPELRDYRRSILSQFDVVLDYAEAGDDADIDRFRDELLRRDMYYDALRSDIGRDRRDRIVDGLVERNRVLGDDARPLVRSPHDEFWAAVRDEFAHETALSFVDTHFTFTGPIREDPAAFAFSTGVDPGDVLGILGKGLPSIEVDFSDEAKRVMRRAEASVKRQARREVERRYADGDAE